jgi:hypothetical protein
MSSYGSTIIPLFEYSVDNLATPVVTKPRGGDFSQYHEIVARYVTKSGINVPVIVEFPEDEPLLFDNGLRFPPKKEGDAANSGPQKRSAAMIIGDTRHEECYKNFFTSNRDWSAAAICEPSNRRKLGGGERYSSVEMLRAIMAKPFSQSTDDDGNPVGKFTRYLKLREYDGKWETQFVRPTAEGGTHIPPDVLFDRSFYGIPAVRFRRVFIGAQVISTQFFLDSVVVTLILSAVTKAPMQRSVAARWAIANPDAAAKLAKTMEEAELTIENTTLAETTPDVSGEKPASSGAFSSNAAVATSPPQPDWVKTAVDPPAEDAVAAEEEKKEDDTKPSATSSATEKRVSVVVRRRVAAN